MENRNQFAKKINYLPITLTVVMIVVCIVGILRLYYLGEDAMQAATLTEKKAMSVAIDPDMPYDQNQICSSVYRALGNIISSDGVTLYGPVKKSAGKAFYNLVGEIGENYNYVASAYRNQLVNQYSKWSGLAVKGENNLPLTINSSLQTNVYNYMAKNGIDGTAVAYDYTTGEILFMVSTPAADIADMYMVNELPAGSLMNKNLYTTVPGSTMKVITLWLAYLQGIDLKEINYTCEKTYSLKTGDKIVCTGKHGRIDVEEALGKSCNCYFAQLVEKKLDLNQAKLDLARMGFVLDEKSNSGTLGLLNCKKPKTKITETVDFDTVWAFLGQGKTMVNPIFMCQFVGELAADNQAMVPRLVMNEEPVESMLCDIADTSTLKTLWEKAFQEYYPSNRYSSLITSAKTGTAQLRDGKEEQKLLLGYSADLNVSFYICFENYIDSEGNKLKVLPVDLVNIVLQQIKDGY